MSQPLRSGPDHTGTASPQHRMKMMLELVLLLSATALTIAAPTVMEVTSETTTNMEDLAHLKEKSNDDKESASIVKDQQKLNPDESPVIKEILDKLDKSDITKVIDEEMAAKAKNAVDDMMMTHEVAKIDVKASSSDQKTEDSTNKLTNSMIKKSDNIDYIKKISEDADKQLKDVASAVAEVVTSLPVPARPDAPNKYTEVIGHFISELMQIPMVLLHAVSTAVASLTNNKVNIPTPTFLSPQSTQVVIPH